MDDGERKKTFHVSSVSPISQSTAHLGRRSQLSDPWHRPQDGAAGDAAHCTDDGVSVCRQLTSVPGQLLS